MLRFVPLRRRIQTGLSRVFERIHPIEMEMLEHMAVWGLSDYGRCAFGSGHPSRLARFSHHVLQAAL